MARNYYRTFLFAMLMIGLASHVASAQIETVLHSFGDGSILNDGADPSGLVEGRDGNFYGTTFDGGASNLGTVFKITPAGTLTLLHSFSGSDGEYPVSALVQGSDGDFYGTTYHGAPTGMRGDGTAFKVTSSGTFTVLHVFQDGNVANDGANPNTALVQGEDGNFYGTTESGGSNVGVGAAYKMTPSGTVTILHGFDDGSVTNDGAHPNGLIQGSDGNFYGTTYDGYEFDSFLGYGTVYKITPTGTETILHHFHDGSIPNDGFDPVVALVQGSDGDFYGTTEEGGSTLTTDPYHQGYGTVFKITPSGTITILHNFGDGSVANDGASYASSLIQGTNGNFYGVTEEGGSANLGTTYQITPSGTVTVLHSFGDGSTRSDGMYPGAPLVQGTDGNFYGTTLYGGSTAVPGVAYSGDGAVFNLSPSGMATPIWTCRAVAAASDSSRLLWTRSDGTAGLWSLTASGIQSQVGPAYGPYTGWSAVALAAALDGSSRVLWTNADGRAGLWSFDASDTETVIGPTYGPYAGWTAKAVGVAADGTARVLWSRNDGAAGLWSFDANDAETVIGPTYGPYSGWGAVSLATASTGVSRVLWDDNRQAGLWSFGVNDVETVIGPAYGPYTDWTASAVGAPNDGTARVLWTNTNGMAGIWSFSTDDIQTLVGSAYGPYSGYGAVALGVSTDGTSRVLWDRSNGMAGVWSFGANDLQNMIGTVYGPY